LTVTTRAEESTYAGIVRMVAEAEKSEAPFVRLADRYALWFVLVTLLVAGITWAAGGATRAVAVLVVATPCPLILAAPVALVAGMSVSARRGVVVKGGAVLEQLARCTTLLLDKTGTLTSGHPSLTAVVTAGQLRPAEILRLAGSLDQVSGHVLAGAVVRAARGQGCELETPERADEVPGQGIRGSVSGRQVAVGPTASSKPPGVSPRDRHGRTGIWSSARRPEHPSTRALTGRTGTTCSGRPGSGRHGSTTPATPPRLSCWSRVSASASSSRSSVTPRSARPSATPTSRPSLAGTRPSGWPAPCGTRRRNCNQNCNQRSTHGQRKTRRQPAKAQARAPQTMSGAGGARTHDRRIMSPLL
jgi:E1-E2 ATPase/haloacid dehalogenase-like hydrolase